MQFPQDVYVWLVSIGIITNVGEQNEKGMVILPPNVSNNFDNGYYVGEIIRKNFWQREKKVLSSLANVKADSSKNGKLTNWSFLWLTFESIELKLDTRIKQLILQGQQALIVEVVRQLYEKDQHKQVDNHISIKQKQSKQRVGSSVAIDVKKINLQKSPEESESSLQFLMLLLKSSLGMNLEEILGLFTNQNKYLAHIIVKGINDNFDPIILFYSLLNKYSEKLKYFYQQDSKDAEACFYALKPGFISKNPRVAELTIELFGKLGNIYTWFISDDSKCSGTFLLGIKRHIQLRELFWSFLLKIIQGQQVNFFSTIYDNCYQSQLELIEVTTYLIKLISQSELAEQLTTIGIISNWLEIIINLTDKGIPAKTICFRFIGQVMLYLPECINQNQDSLTYLTDNWNHINLPEFTCLSNELIVILEKLGEDRNAMAKKIYDLVSKIVKMVGQGDKRDYLIQNFLPLIAKFPTIPSQNLIQHLRHHPLSGSEFLLICESIQINNNADTLISVGKHLKMLFLQNPLLHFYLITLLKQIMSKVIQDEEIGAPFLQKTLQDVLQTLSVLEIKFKAKPKQQQSLYFGRNGSPEKVSKFDQELTHIKQKEKQIVQNFIVMITDLSFSKDHQSSQQIIRQKLLDANANIKKNNHKIGSKFIQDLLVRRFEVTKEEQIEHSEEFNKKVNSDMEESSIVKKSKLSNVSMSNKLKGPQNLTKEFQMMIDKRKQEEQERRVHEIKKQMLQEKKRLLAKKEIQISNLLRGHIGQAQLREQGFLEKIMQDNKEPEIILFEDLQNRQIEAIESVMKKYHKVLRHLFLNYTSTMYSSHTNERFEDNQNRKQILTAVQLGKLLKQYKLAFLTNQTEISNFVRDINVKILHKRQVHELDFIGFQQFIMQFCGLIMIRNFTITSSGHDGVTILNKSLKNQPLHVILKQFFNYLKSVFLAKGQKIHIFEDISDIPLNKEQTYQIQILNKKLIENPAYILPKGYKKISENIIDFQYRIGQNFHGISESYIVAMQALNYIFAKAPFAVNIIENISQKKTVYKIKPSSFNIGHQIPKSRAMSTLIDRKSPLINSVKKSSSKGVLNVLKRMPQSDKHIGEEAAGALQRMVDKISHKELVKEKEVAKQRKQASMSKIQQIQKNKFQAHQKTLREKKEAKQAIQRKEKQQQRKRREHTEKYLDEQRSKLVQKRQKDEEIRLQKHRQQQQKERVKKQNQYKFKEFHQSQLEKIKKIGEESITKMKKQRQEQEEKKQQHEQLKKRLREKIEEDDKKLIENRRQMESRVQGMFENETTKRVFSKYEANLRGVYEFLIQHTHLSLTEKKHNNEIVFQTWRYFLNAFELSFLIESKDVNYIFKNITKNKLVPKEYYVGLNYSQFQQAIFKISIKYKTFFNIITQKIKDNIIMEKIEQQKPKDNGKGAKKTKNAKSEPKKEANKAKEQNEFDDNININVKEILRQNTNIKDSEYYGDLSKVSQKTLIGMIYYLRVPNTKPAQQKRFRQILTNKPLQYMHNEQRLKQKLNEQYTLESTSNGKPNANKQPHKETEEESQVNASIKSKK